MITFCAPILLAFPFALLPPIERNEKNKNKGHPNKLKGCRMEAIFEWKINKH